MLKSYLAQSARAFLFASALVVAAQPTLAENTDVSARNKVIVQQAFDNWKQGGSVFAELLASKVVWTIHGSGPVAGTYTNMEDFVERAAVPLTSRLATPLVPEIHSIWSVDDTVIIRFDGSAITTSGQSYQNQFVWIFRMEGGLVIEAEAFLDLTAYQMVINNNAPRGN